MKNKIRSYITGIYLILAVSLLSLFNASSAGKNTDTELNTKKTDPGTGIEKPYNDQMSKSDMYKSMQDMQNRIDELSEKLDKLEKKTDDKLNLKINGFFDVNVSNYQNKPNIFNIGSFELELVHNYEKNFQVAAALVFDEGAKLGVGFIDYHLFGGTISPRGRLYAEKGIHLQVGKFDVPFGNDWQYFTAPEMISVTSPLTTEVIMDGGYNDVGVRLLSNFVSFNFTLYMLRGIEQGYSYGGNSYGGRVGFTPFSTPYQLNAKAKPELDVGVSYIGDFSKGGETAETLKAVDFESTLGMFTLRSEYYERDKKVGILYKGYHVTGSLDFGVISSVPVTIFGRYEYVLTSRYEVPKEDNILRRGAVGLNINISSISYLKFEYQKYLEVYDDYMEDEYFNDQLYYLQLIITF